MPATHFAKTPEGAILVFGAVGFARAAADAFEQAAALDAELDPSSLERLALALAELRSWTPASLRPAGPPIPSWTLSLPTSTEGRSSPQLAVDPGEASSAIARAEKFNPERSFANGLARSRSWRAGDGKLLELPPVLGRPLGLARDSAWELAEAGNLMGSGRAFALYAPASRGYYETISASRHSTAAPLSRARLFESAKDARAFSSKVKMRKAVSVVEVRVRALRAVELSEGGDHTPLMAAISRAEAAELHALMAESELADLKTRLATLEAERSIGASPKPRASRL